MLMVSVLAGWLKGTHHLVHRILQLYQLAFNPHTFTAFHPAFYMDSGADVGPRFATSLRGVAYCYRCAKL
jgi:hypothetical protein